MGKESRREEERKQKDEREGKKGKMYSITATKETTTHCITLLKKTKSRLLDS
jgi:hypothetical protein